MKNNRLPSLIALTISLEMILSPLPALANQSFGQKALNTLQFGMQMYDTVRGGPGGGAGGALPPHVQTDMAAFKTQQTPVPDKYFSWQNLSKIPGLAEYIAKKNHDASFAGGKGIDPNQFNCPTLPTTIHEAKNQACLSQQSGIPIGSQAEADEAFAYYNQYEQISKLYRNYSVESNSSTQLYGVGCMKRAMEILNGFFKYRLDQIDTIVAVMDDKIQAFEKSAEAVQALNEVKESSAFLNGPDSTFGREIKDENFFNYAKELGPDSGCGSIQAADVMNNNGKSGGIKGISELLKGEANKPVSGFTLATYTQKNADVEKDIRELSKKVGRHIKNNFAGIANSEQGYNEFLSRLGSEVGSEQGVHNALNPAFFTDVRGKFSEKRQALTREINLIRSEIGQTAAFDQLADEDESTFEAEVTSLQNQIKGECLAKNSGLDSAINRITDVSVSSKTANKASTNQIKKRIKEIMADVQMTPERKLAELQELETRNGGRYEIRLDGDYETEEISNGQLVRKTVNAASKVTPRAYFTDLIRNCESKFEVNKLRNKMSAKEAIKRLRTLKKDFQKASRQHQDDVQREIVRKMIDCNGDVAAQNSSVEGSCSADKLNTSSPKFCSKAAFSCSRNMQQCQKKTADLIAKKTQIRKQATEKYNRNVDKVAAAMDGMLVDSLNKYTKEAELLRGMFGAGDFSLPKRVQPPEGGAEFKREFMSSSDPDRIKDPKAYLQNFRENMTNLRETIRKQQDQILGGSLESPSGVLAKHMTDTVKKYNDEVIKKADAMAKECYRSYASYNQGISKANEQLAKDQGELGEKKAEFCNQYEDIMKDNVAPACDDKSGGLASDLIKAASKVGDQATINRARQMQSELRTYCNQPGNQRDKEGGSATKWSDVCAKFKRDSSDISKDTAKLLKPLCDRIELKIECYSKSTDSNGKETSNYICGKEEEMIVSIYNQTARNSVTVANQSPPSTADHSSFCYGSNNSGPFNFKGGFPDMQNPMGPPSGTRGFGL